jgi:ribosomal protein S27E
VEPHIVQAFSVAKPSDDHSAWRLCFVRLFGFRVLGFKVFGFKSCFEQVMTISKAAQVAQASIGHSRFRIVCSNCDSLGMVFDCPEGAPPSTQIKCRHCGAPRGTLGELRALSCSDRRDLFEV